MDQLVKAVLGCMERREAPPVGVLARLGAPDPVEAAEAFRQAAGLPELAACAETWAPLSLKSAHPGRSALRMAELVVEGRAAGRGGPPASQLPALAALLGIGEPFAEWVRERPDWSSSLAIGDAVKPPRPVWSEIRDAHAKGLLQLGARWMLGATVGESLRGLSQLADRCIAAALECAAGETGFTPPAVMAWGRFGAHEPGLVCGLELLLVDADRGVPERRAEAEALFERLREELPQPFEAGITWRFGLGEMDRQRGAIDTVQSIPDAVAYWRGHGSLRQRAALISLRQVAGPPEVATEFKSEIGALLGRCRGDAVDDRAAWKRRTSRFELDDPLVAEADLVSGPCGMGALERAVGALALHSIGPADATLPDTVARIASHSRSAALDRVAHGFAAAHGWLRRAELALGLLASPSPIIPSDCEGQLALARTMGYADSDARRALARFLYDWRAVRDEVYEIGNRIGTEMEN